MTPVLFWYGHAEAGCPMQRVAGLSLALRCVLTAQKLGCEDISLAVLADDLRAVKQEMTDARVTVTVRTGVAPAQVSQALPSDVQETVVARGDCVLLPDVFKQLLETLPSDTGLRSLEDTSGDAIGLFRTTQAAAKHLSFDADATISSPGIEQRRVVAGWHVVASPRDTGAAERLLVHALIKPADGLVARNINRKISIAISRRIANTSMRPNHATLVVLLIGVASGPFAMQGTYWGFALAGLCYYVSSVLDGVDGELSRLLHYASPLGAWLDTVTDDVVGLSYLCGLYAGLSRSSTHPYWMWIGVATIIFYVGSVLPRYYLFVTKVGIGDHQALAAQTRPKNPTGLQKFMLVVITDTIARIDFLTFAAAVLGLLGIIHIWAAGYALGAAIMMVDTIKIWRRVRST